MNKNLLFIVIVTVFIAVVLFVAGCARHTGKPAREQIALITDFGGPNDFARNESAYSGLEQVAAGKNGRIFVKMFENAADRSNAEYLVRLTAAEDYSLVFLFAGDLAGKMPNIAATYPETRFVCLDAGAGKAAPENLQYACFDEEQAAMAAGALAGLAGKSGVVAFLDLSAAGGKSRYRSGFLAGMQAVNKKAKVLFIEKSDLLKKGPAFYDVLFINGTFAGQFEIVKNLKAGIRVITCGANVAGHLDKEQTGRILAAVQKNTGKVLEKIVQQVQSGKYQSGTVMYGLNEGMDVIPADGQLDSLQMKKFEKICAEITAGNLEAVK